VKPANVVVTTKVKSVSITEYLTLDWVTRMSAINLPMPPSVNGMSERATKAAGSAEVLRGLDWLETGSEEGDVNLLFLAGHGVTSEKGYFYYLPADAQPDNLRATGVGRDEVLRTIKNRKGAMLSCWTPASQERA